MALSEQQLIDCDRGPPFDDNGCHAGWVDGGWSYLIKNGGQAALSHYPNTGWENDKCDSRAEDKCVCIPSLSHSPFPHPPSLSLSPSLTHSHTHNVEWGGWGLELPHQKWGPSTSQPLP